MNSEGCKCIKQVDSFHAVCISAVAYTLENFLQKVFAHFHAVCFSIRNVNSASVFTPCAHVQQG